MPTFLSRMVQGTASSAGRVYLPTSGIVASDSDVAGPVEAKLQVRTDGTIHSVGLFSGDVTLLTWKLVGDAADYEIRATTSSGSVTGTTGSWVSLSSDFELSKTRAIAGAGTWLGKLEIRDAVSLEVLAFTDADGVEITVDIS